MRQKRFVVRCLQAAVWKEHHTALCTCAHGQSAWTTPTLTLLYITLMTSPVCEALHSQHQPIKQPIISRKHDLPGSIDLNNTQKLYVFPWWANASRRRCQQQRTHLQELQGFATRYFLLCHSNLDKMTFGPRIPHLKGFQWGPVHGREPPRSVQTNRPSALWPQRRENTKDKLRLRDLRLRTDDTRPPQPILNIETIWNTWDLRDCLCPVAD